MSKALQKFPIVGMIIFLAIGLLAGFVNSYVVDAVGATGHIATMLLLSMMFTAWSYIRKAPMTLITFLYFVLMGLGTTVVTSMLSDALVITDAMLQSLLFFGLFFIVLVFLGGRKTPTTS